MHRPESKTENTENTKNTENTEQSIQSDDQSTAQPHQRITNIDMVSDQQADEKPVVSSAVNLAVIFGTLIFPIVGIAMGFTYLRKPNIEAQRVGKTWLVLGLIILLIQIVMIAIR